jgi:cellulose synthase/poly-beta-1,6-N-acetylglucosamine synthase-like glycosyltransferase
MTYFASVVVPCYNSIRTLMECLDSLRNQTHPRELYEVIVADNGSTDGSLDLIREHFAQFRLVHARQKGSGYARNAGIAAARGEIILSIDSDCVADRNWVSAMMSAFQGASPEIAAFGGMIEPYSRVTSVEMYERYWVRQENLRVRYGPVRYAEVTNTAIRYAETPNAAFRADVLRELGCFDGTLGFDDTDLGIRLQQAGYRIEFVPDAIVKHRNPATWREVFQHRRKYGKFNFTLALKHPALRQQDISARSVAERLLLLTVRRVLVAILIKLPFAVLTGRGGPPRVWPAIDAVDALAGYLGFREARAEVKKAPVD